MLRDIRVYGWRVAFWWQVEQAAGWLWERASGDRVTCWLDWLPAWAYVRRKNAERRRRE